jgi:para-nitrobenzyl esterase
VVLPVAALICLAAGCAGSQPQPQPARASPVASGGALPAEIVGVTWEWVSFTTPVEQIQVDSPASYTIRLDPDGKLAMKADCNRGMSSWTAGPDRRIQIAPIALTRMLCPPGSLGERFAREAGRASIWFQKDGDLYFDLPVDSGTLRFRRRQPQ